MAEYLITTGLSGAGRSSASATLEDLGWFVIDNLPPTLITKVAELADTRGSERERFCFVVGRGGPDTTAELFPAIKALRASGARVRVLFLDASDEALVCRFEGTRRRHPLDAGGVLGAIRQERALLAELKATADTVIDTSDINVHELRDQLVQLFAPTSAGRPMEVAVVSFGFKYGLPLDVDLVFDCRFLPNPHWIENLRPLTGLDNPVRDYVLGDDETQELLARLVDLFGFLLPAYAKEGKAYLSVGIGCTGGRHRSVVVAEELGKGITAIGFDPAIHHRDIEK